MTNIVQSRLNIIPFSLLKDPNNSITQSSSSTVSASKKSEVPQQITENPCSPQKTEKRTQTVQSTLSQSVQSREETVKGTHVQPEPKDKPTTPGKLFFNFNEFKELSLKSPMLKTIC